MSHSFQEAGKRWGCSLLVSDTSINSCCFFDFLSVLQSYEFWKPSTLCSHPILRDSLSWRPQYRSVSKHWDLTGSAATLRPGIGLNGWNNNHPRDWLWMVNVHDLNLIRNACISGVAQLNTECNRGAGLLAEIDWQISARTPKTFLCAQQTWTSFLSI